MAVAGIYRRVLPSPPAIEFASPDGKKLFSEALHTGTMECFFKLISYFQTQSEPAYCGLASLAMVLNALLIDPGKKWKGPWRWFDESMLDCCEPLEKVKAEGITFGKVACLAHCAGAKVEAFRTNRSTIDNFRNHVVQCTSSEDCHLIVSYHRKAFQQTGSGHFSPIGGYHAGKDMVLILDVARFKYPPHWVPLALLWEAMDTIDEASGHPRGFMIISKRQQVPSLLYTLNCRHESWLKTVKFFLDDVPHLLKLEDLKTVCEVLFLLFQSLPSNVGDFITWVAEVRRQEEDWSNFSKEEKGRLALKEKVLQQVHDTKLFKFVMECLLAANSGCKGAPTSTTGDSLPEIAASVCCQGAEMLNGAHGAGDRFFCRETSVTCLKNDDDMAMTVVSGTVASGGNDQGIDMLLPVLSAKTSPCVSEQNNCIKMHPASGDLLTVLLLSLPPHTWSSIRDEKLMAKVHALVSTENLPECLQEEVLHLRQQLHFLKRCKDNEVDDYIDLPSALNNLTPLFSVSSSQKI